MAQLSENNCSFYLGALLHITIITIISTITTIITTITTIIGTITTIIIVPHSYHSTSTFLEHNYPQLFTAYHNYNCAFVAFKSRRTRHVRSQGHGPELEPKWQIATAARVLRGWDQV